MMPMTLAELSNLLGGGLYGVPGSAVCHGFCWDSTLVKPGDVFLAVKGARHDGHDFVSDAVARGASVAVCERPVPGPCLRVDSLIDSLARMGSELRGRFTGPVVGVTGSNGKTTTKEMLATALAPLGRVLKSESNHNTELTSPLTWTRLDGHQAAVIELAMRGPGQIAHLAKISRPTVGLITGIGTAHVEMLGSREGVMRAKGEILASLTSDNVAVLPRDDEFFAELCERAPGPVVTFGFDASADVRVTGYRALTLGSCRVRIEAQGGAVDFELPTVGRHQASNASAAIAAAMACGVNIESAAENLHKSEFPRMRMEVVELNGATVLLDSYNASPDSTVAAIRTLSEVPATSRRFAILGEMLELGDFAESGHRMVGRAVAASEIDRVLFVGSPMRLALEEARMAGFPAESLELCPTVDLGRLAEFIAEVSEGDVLLIKGSRALGLERALSGAAV